MWMSKTGALHLHPHSIVKLIDGNDWNSTFFAYSACPQQKSGRRKLGVVGTKREERLPTTDQKNDDVDVKDWNTTPPSS